MAVAALKGDKTLVELAQQHDVHPNQIADGRRNCWSELPRCLPESRPLELTRVSDGL